MKYTLLSCFLMACTSSLFSQVRYNYETRLEGFEYIDVAKGANNEQLPLLIAFHYSSGSPLEIISDYDSIKSPVRIVIPKGNYKKRDGFSYYPTDYYQQDSLTQWSLSQIAVDSIARFVRAIEAKYKQKAIVSGISQGGDLAFLLAVKYPELCRAAFPMAAVIHSNIIRQIETIKDKIPIYLLQGEVDKIVSVAYTRKKVEEIGLGLQITLITYPNVGHDISPQMKVDYSKSIDELVR